MSDLILFWHRRDLRLSDNVGLAAARQRSPKVVGVFCLDPHILKRDDVAPARVAYMIGCLQELQQRYAEAGSHLLILQGEPNKAVLALAVALNARAVFWNFDVEPYSQERDRAVVSALKIARIPVHNCWDQLLHAPQEICSGPGKPYTIYTPFWKNWIRKPKAEPLPAFKEAIALTEAEQHAARLAGASELPTAKDLGFTWDKPLPVQPGEKAAKEKLQEFCDRAIYDYDEQRNYPSSNGTSQLSAALKFGAIGIRTVWDATSRLWDECGSDRDRAGIYTWRQELAWREFYQHVMYNFPELATGAYREFAKDFPWDDNPEHFQAWCEGKTGYPIVDAAMRQMKEIGWMHNRCRMIVASFLTKDLIVNWQWGEKYFMQMLVDGDLSANNGGWQWSASSGMDPKPLRIFNPATQAKKFDPNAEYIRQWIPELSCVDTELLIAGKIPDSQRDSVGYPAPIVDHNLQQRRFKELYQQQKAVSD